jgi:uncharacterized sulfatase
MFDRDGRRVEFGGYRVGTQTDLVLDYLQDRDSNKPFFLFVSCGALPGAARLEGNI